MQFERRGFISFVRGSYKQTILLYRETDSFSLLFCFSNHLWKLFFSQLEKLIEKNYYLHKSAREAYRSYLQAYASHQHKSIFNVNALDLQRVAPAFGFVVPPRVNLSILLPPSKLSFHITYPSRPLLFNSGEVSVLGQEKVPYWDFGLFLCPILVIRRKSIFLDCITELTNISSL